MHTKLPFLLLPWLLCHSALIAADPAFTFNAIGQTRSENFDGYRGTLETLPSDIFVGWDQRISTPFQGVNTGALTAYTADNVGYAFGIRERSPVDLRDARMFLPIKNNTEQAIRYLLVTYDVEAWFIGNRRNRIRMKYDTFLDPLVAGRETFETDIFSTDNPSTERTANTAVDGSLPENRVAVSGIVDLQTLDDGSGNFFPSLAPGETAWFRWQFSNASGDGGTLRSGLAINNLSITPLADLPDLQWRPGLGGSGIWQPSGGTDWSGGSWAQERNAIFADAPGIITLGGDIEALNVRFSSGYTLTGDSSASLFASNGLFVDESVTAFLGVRLADSGGLRKLGGGVLEVIGGQNYTGTTELVSGILRLTDEEALPATAPLIITPGAVFDLNGQIQTVAGVNGERNGSIQLGTGGTLILDVPVGSFAYRADLVGDGNMIKRGLGAQRFRSEKKTYTGFTRIEEGTLEVTGNGEMTGTSAIDVMPAGELFFVGDSSSGPPAAFGAPISLRGGRLSFQNVGEEAFYFVDGEVQILEDNSTINVSGAESTAIFDAGFGGAITGAARFSKTGAGALELAGRHSHTGGLEVSDGSVIVSNGASLEPSPLLFTEEGSIRSFLIENSGHTVTLLDGVSPDPDLGNVLNTLTLAIGTEATLTVDQPIILDGDDETSTRFQGVIEGAGNLVKDGDGFLHLTRWPKTYTGSTSIRQGVLGVSASAALGNTLDITVHAGGQLRLTSAGRDVAYQFGGNLSLAGAGRSGAVAPASGFGILGALRYEPDANESSAIVGNDIIFDNGSSVNVHVSGSSNTLTLAGNLTGAGPLPIETTGGGVLRVAAASDALNKPWSIINGRLEILPGASSGNGSLQVSEKGALAGRGHVGGSVTLEGSLDLGTTADALRVAGDLALESGGRILLTLPVTEPRLSVAGRATSTGGAIIELGGDLAAGTYPVFSASGFSGEPPAVDGLPVGLTAALSFDESSETLFLILSPSVSGGFAGWVGGFGLAPTDVGPRAKPAGDGVPNLLKYALGVAPLASATGVLPMAGFVAIDANDYLMFEAVLRSDDPALNIVAEGSNNLQDWSLPLIELGALDQSGVPNGFERRAWRTAHPVVGGQVFLRLRTSINED